MSCFVARARQLDADVDGSGDDWHDGVDDVSNAGVGGNASGSE